MKRWESANRFEKKELVEYDIMDKYSTEKIVDETNYRPSAENVRAHMLSPGGLGSKLVGIYDFKDGKDTGFNPYRDIGADIVDLQRAEEDIINSAKSKKIKEAELAAQKEAVKEAVKSAFIEGENEAVEAQ